MNRFILLLTLLTSHYVGVAQDKPATLFNGERNVTITGFGGPFLELSGLAGQGMLSVGGGGGIMVNNRFFLGAYGQGNATGLPVRLSGQDRWVHYSHGGFWLGYRFSPNRLLNVVADTRLGWATASVSAWRDDDDAYGPADGRDRSFVATPSVGVELNVTDFLRVALTGGYRFSSGLALDAARMQPNAGVPVLRNADVQSPVAMLTVKFGWFR